MPRCARENNLSEYSHIIQRGIGKQLLFENNPDYQYYIRLLEKYSCETGVSICAYCLMENHVHLLVRDTGNAVPLMMKKIGISYAYYFNNLYERSGHLFQDRYKSEPVLDSEYLLTVLRYILTNPEKSGICPASEYPWSSYRFYGREDTFVDTSFLSELFGTRENYIEYMSLSDDSKCMEHYGSRTSDAMAKEIIRERLGFESGTKLQSLDKKRRNEAIRTLLDAGLSIRQIERLTGISRGVIQNIVW